MKKITAAVEHNVRNAGGLGTFGNQLADLGSAIDIPAFAGLEFLVLRRGRSESRAGGVVDDLRIDMPAGTEHAETRPTVLRDAPQLRANAIAPPDCQIA